VKEIPDGDVLVQRQQRTDKGEAADDFAFHVETLCMGSASALAVGAGSGQRIVGAGVVFAEMGYLRRLWPVHRAGAGQERFLCAIGGSEPQYPFSAAQDDVQQGQGSARFGASPGFGGCVDYITKLAFWNANSVSVA